MPIAPAKTKVERVNEVVGLLKKLKDCLGQTDQILEFKKILDQWIEDGQYRKGKIKLVGYERILHYDLYARQGMDIEICLKYVKGL